MGQPDYLDLDPQVVASAGSRTAMTAADWGGWASRSETLLRNASGGARQGKVTGAFDTYLSQWNPKLRGLASRANGLGSNAVSASHTVDNSDGDSAGILQTQASEQQAQASQLRRPINGPH